MATVVSVGAQDGVFDVVIAIGRRQGGIGSTARLKELMKGQVRVVDEEIILRTLVLLPGLYHICVLEYGVIADVGQHMDEVGGRDLVDRDDLDRGVVVFGIELLLHGL